MLKTTDGRRIPENERRKDDIRQMGDHRLKGLVLRCIEDKSDERLNAKEVVDWLQKVKKSKIERKRTIALQREPNQPPTHWGSSDRKDLYYQTVCRQLL